MLTVYLTLDKNVGPERISQLAKKIQNLDKKILDDAISSLFSKP
jgi:DNA-binding HxlR family transcriptional regulator